MPALVARDVLRPLIGTTVGTPSRGEPNEILEMTASDVSVRTASSDATGAPVALEKVQLAIDLLLEHGAVPISPSTFGDYRRSAFLGAVLTSLPAVEVDAAESPTVVRLAGASPLRDHLLATFDLVPEPRLGAGRVVAGDPLFRLLTQELKAAIASNVERPGYLVRGSVGQPNFTWATTPWVAVFDRLVTESAQRGHYVVFLIDHDGSGGYLSLMQGVTESAGAGSEGRLLARSEQLRGLIPAEDLNGLHLGPLDLSGGGWRTTGYNVGSIAALRLDRAALPHDAVTIFQLRRFLRLCDTVTANLDEIAAVRDDQVPADAQKGEEARRYRWHLRAEGRNRSVVQRAKRLHGYHCDVCGRDFVAELGERGKRCIDADHLTPFADMDGRPTTIDPKTDFAIVCANCHRLLHSETPPMAPAALREQLLGRP